MHNQLAHQPAGKTIHVPQGKSARLMQATLSYGISGLYTCGFTTCNILALIGSSKLLLIHADLLTDPTEEYAWIENELKEVVLIYRGAYEAALTSQMRPKLQEQFGEKLKVIPMDDNHDGVYLSFEQNHHGFHEYIRKYPLGINPDNILRHPLEQTMLAVQKIEQVIGLRAKVRTGKARKRFMNVFDGRAWEAMADHDLKIDDTHQLTKAELKFFSSNDDYVTVGGKMASLIGSFEGEVQRMGSSKELAIPVAFELEGYLNDFDAPKLFKRNIKVLFDKKLPNSIFSMVKPTSKEDNDIGNLIGKENSSEGIIARLENYRAIAPNTPFKKELMDNFDTLHRHYRERMIYTELAREREALAKRFESLVQKATPHFQKQEFAAAQNLFFDALKIASECFLKDDPALASAYWNFGRTLQKLGDGENAIFFIRSALTLREAYQPNDGPLIEKPKMALRECEEMIKKSNVLAQSVEAQKQFG